MYVAPEMRLAGAVLQICLALDTHNRSKAPAQEPTPMARERAAQQEWQRGADNVAAPPAEFDDL